jgi:poly-gamma-glutamate synthesis protein (capsule biosynthesis protein)
MPRQTNLAAKIFNWGADVILGSHPHVIQKSEIMNIQDKNRYVVYSMGNFISNYRREDQDERKNKIYTEDGVIIKLNFEKKIVDGEIQVSLYSVNTIPTWVDKYLLNNKIIYKILPITSPDPLDNFINDTNRDRIKNSYQNTFELLKDYDIIN